MWQARHNSVTGMAIEIASTIAKSTFVDSFYSPRKTCCIIRGVECFPISYEDHSMYIPKILEAHPLDNYKIRLRFSDHSAGTVDLSHLTGKGVFTSWNKYENFKNITIENGRRLVWPDEIDIDADSLYLRLTGKTSEELFPALKEDYVHA